MESQRIFVFALLLFSVYASRAADLIPEDDDPLQPLFQNRVRRFVQVRFKSRKPDPEAQDEYGIGLPGHVMNVLKGGTFGVDFKIKHIDKIGKGLSDMGWGWHGKKKSEWENNEKEERSVDYSHIINPRVHKRPEP